MLYFMENCVNTIRTLPALQIDETYPEDVRHCKYDHLGDALRYLVTCRPYIPSTYVPLTTNEFATESKGSSVRIDPPAEGWLSELDRPAKRISLTGRRIA